MAEEHFTFTVSFEQAQQLPANHQARLVRRHVQFHSPASIDTGVVIGGFEDVAVFGGDCCVPVDQFPGRALLFAVIAVQPLDRISRPSSMGVAQL